MPSSEHPAPDQQGEPTGLASVFIQSVSSSGPSAAADGKEASTVAHCCFWLLQHAWFDGYHPVSMETNEIIANTFPLSIHPGLRTAAPRGPVDSSVD